MACVYTPTPVRRVSTAGLASMSTRITAKASRRPAATWVATLVTWNNG